MLLSQRAESSGHKIVICRVLVKTWTNNQITEKEVAATIPRPAPLSQVYMFFLNAYFPMMVKCFMLISQ
jgi:hypothetical protein